MLISFIVAAVLFLVVVYCIYLYAFGRSKPGATYSEPPGQQFRLYGEEIKNRSEAMKNFPFETVTTESRDGLKLTASYSHFRDNAPLVIFFHGYRSTGIRDFCGGFYFYRDQGFNILVVDQRSTGRSEGKTITFGIYEHLDCLRWADFAAQKFPDCKIIFCTGYEEYAVSAFKLHVSGYLMKPITAEAVQKEIDHIKGLKAKEKLLTVKCFGNFEVLYNGESLPFKRKKAKELLAILIDRKGAGMTAKQICAILFPDDTDDTKNAAYLRQLVLDLKNTLKTIPAEEVLRHDTPYYRIDTNLVSCDYLSFLETGKPKFLGEYMTQYSWAEEACAMLEFKK